MIENREKWEKERTEIAAKVRADLREVLKKGIDGYEGFVAATETAEQAFNDRVKSSRWVLKMLAEVAKV